MGRNVLINNPTPGYKRWNELSSKIPDPELALLAKDKEFSHLAGDREALSLAWFAKEAGNDPTLIKRPLVREMWDTFSSLVADLFEKAGLRKPDMRKLRDPEFVAEVKDLLILARNVVVKGGGQTPKSVATSSTSGRTGRPVAPRYPSNAAPCLGV